jgi:ABC-type multidrug transport system ATPase subunit
MYLKISNLHLTFDTGKQLFRNQSFELSGPNLYFLTGQNGAGKSTLARLLAGLVHHAAHITGVIDLNGKKLDVSQAGSQSYLYQQVFYISQHTNEMIAPNFTTQENLALANLPNHPGLNLFKAGATQSFDLPMHIAAKYLSGGQKQLLAIAMAAQKNPAVLVLDEPTAALDEQNAILVMNLIRQISNQILCICICHDDQLMQRYPMAQTLKLN